ncbi:hypothetical protein J6TS1_21790 [Siminovitchia terrae]|uniref:Uncharacterized protein n=1 Tax=Siminovitchia terrae TaxID=1914933 RepID=A0ABQ4KXD8_SIMTE|nr:hypothetical protein [Siminovitchia terrae]GIN89666.1 hypothetical protein J22TS1_07170 [Siminovitchia terrae]GIN96309.1 hypothetical protein J6TS1_21790 [Siminovitchia terrae]
MGCCGPEYRKQVLEKETTVNAKGRESLPLYVKILSLVVLVGAIGLVVIL